MWRRTSYVALHPFRTGALPTYRVHCLRIGCTAHANKPKHGYAHLHTHRPCTTHYCDALLGQTLRYLLASATPPSSATLPLTSPTAACVATTQGTTSTTGRCTRYVALHPLRSAAPDQNGCIAYGSGAAPTDRVQRPHSQAQTRIRTPPHAQAMHHPLLRRTTWTDIALLTRQRNAPHLAQHSHSQTQPRRASQPHRAPHPQQGTAPVMWRCTSYVALHPIRTGALPTDRVHCLRIGCSAHTHKPNRGEHPAARSLRPATVRTFTNSARNSLTATRNNTPETAGFQRSDFKS